MPSRTAAAQRFAGTACSPCSSHIWISEELLQQTYTRFAARLTTQAKRHGSNVPGPLEASRRLSKRRFNDVSLATRGVVPSLDPAINIGWLGKLWTRSLEQDWKWEPPCSQSEESRIKRRMGQTRSIHAEFSDYDITITFPDLPSWFNGKSQSSPTPLTVASRSPEVVPPAVVQLSSASTQSKTIEDYKALLAEVHDLEALRKLYFLFREANVDASLCSTLAFSHFLALYQDLRQEEHHEASAVRSSLFEFLQDPLLDLSKGLNILHMVEFLELEMVSIEECNTLIEMLPGQLLQHQAISHAISMLTQKLLGIIFKVYDSDPLGSLIDSYKKIWLAFQHVRTLIPRSQDAAITRTLLCHVLELPVRKQTRRFLKLILRYDSEQFRVFLAGADYSKGISEQTWKHNEEWCQLLVRTSRFLFLYDSRNAHRKGTLLSNRTNNFLASLKHSSYVEAWAVCTTNQIIRNVLDKVSIRDADLEILRHWLKAIGKSGYVWSMEYNGKLWATLFDVIANVFTPADILLHLPAPPWHAMQTLTLRHWVKRSLDVQSVTNNVHNLLLNPLIQDNALMAATADETGNTNDCHKANTGTSTATTLSLLGSPQASDNFLQYRRRTMHLHTLEHAVDTYIEKVETIYSTLVNEETVSYTVGGYDIRGVAKYDLYMLQALEQVKKNSYDLAAEYFLEMALARGSWRAFDLTARGIKLSLHLQTTLRHRRLLEQYIRKYSKQRPATALRIYHLDRRLSLSRVPRLPLDLISTSPRVKIKHALSLLWHSDQGAFVPPADRFYNPKCAITPERIFLVHEVALRIAMSDHYTASAAWQAVTRCYYFLRTHSAPLGPMLSRAIVVAGLVKPMQTWQHINLDKIRFVVRVVGEIEGEETADKVDRAMLAYYKKCRHKSMVKT